MMVEKTVALRVVLKVDWKVASLVDWKDYCVQNDDCIIRLL